MNTRWVACPLSWLTADLGSSLGDSLDGKAGPDELTAILNGDPMSSASIAPCPAMFLGKTMAERNVVSIESMAISADSAITRRGEVCDRFAEARTATVSPSEHRSNSFVWGSTHVSWGV